MTQKKELMTRRSCRREFSKQRLDMLWAEPVKQLFLHEPNISDVSRVSDVCQKVRFAASQALLLSRG